MIELFDYFRSTASYRVRIALAFKELPVECREIHLVQDGGQQHQAFYQAINPQCLVPTLKEADFELTQSIAILEYLEEKYPTPALMPADLTTRAKVRQLAQLIACDIHPLNNLRVLQYLVNEFGHSEADKMQWYHHWIQQGFQALESWLEKYQSNGQFCFGEQPTLADVCLVPQVYNAHRFECDMQTYPLISSINKHCLTLAAFASTAP